MDHLGPVQSLQPADVALELRQVALGLDDVAGAGLTLGPDHRRALGDPAQRLAQVAAAAHERHLELVLVDVALLVGRRQDLGLIYVVDLERFEHLGFDRVADAALGHDRDRHRGLDRLDQARVGHAGHAAIAPDVGGHPLQRHHGTGPGVLGDARVLGRDHVHDHAALEHLRQAPLHRRRRLLNHRHVLPMPRAATRLRMRYTPHY